MEEKKKFRISFLANCGMHVVHKDVAAQDSDEAFSIAYKMPEVRSGMYDEISLMEIPQGPTVIGVKFQYYDSVFKEHFHDRIFILANNEEEAIEYYNKHYKGKRFIHEPACTVEDGKCVRGDVVETYFAAGGMYHADATKSK